MLFQRKNNKEKIIKEMKKKKQQYDKLLAESNKIKEEIDNMGKLVLKDGKLTKVEDNKSKDEMPAMPEPPKPPQQQFSQSVTKESIDFQRQAEEVARMVEAQKRQQMQQEYLRMQQELNNRQEAESPQQYYQQMPPQQVLHQTPYPQQPQQQEYEFTAVIRTVLGDTFEISIPQSQFNDFSEKLIEAIDNQSSFQFNNRIVNGRNIVDFIFE